MNVLVLERVLHHAPLGLRFWDTAAATSSVEGLEVDIFPRARPHARTRAFANRSGVYVALNVIDLRDLELGDAAPGELSPALLRPYRVEVNDPRGRFQPIAFDADLPAQGLFTFYSRSYSPPRAIALPGATGSPPQLLLERIPLFSTAQRQLPEPLAVVYAQLRESADPDRPAAWALLAASVEGEARGLGLADAQGRVAVMFPYPEPPRIALSSPPAARSEFHWPVQLQAYYRVGSPPEAPPEIPDLSDVLSQLDLPRELVGLTASPPSLPLEYRVPLTARSASSSLLFVSTGSP